MADALTEYLAELERALKVHPRRRSRILAEIESHLQESAAQHGAAKAIARLGRPSELATSFTPGLTDRLWAERDRLAALAMLAALLACVPLARDLWETNNGDRGVVVYSIFSRPRRSSRRRPRSSCCCDGRPAGDWSRPSWCSWRSPRSSRCSTCRPSPA